MSTLTTLSKFYYGHVVTSLNRYIDFKEGSLANPELTATLNVGDYTATEYAAEVQRAMRVAGALVYTVSFNRTTRKLTISAPSNFYLTVTGGSHLGTTAYTMMGFTGNFGPVTTATANTTTGKEYRNQYPLFKYTDPSENLVKETASVNVSAVGVTQLISFGDGARAEMNIRLITNKTGLKNNPFYENVNGKADAIEFMSYVISKYKVEFMPDVDIPATFYKLIIESTGDSRNGTEFYLKNMKTPGVYETGNLVFRKVLT